MSEGVSLRKRYAIDSPRSGLLEWLEGPVSSASRILEVALDIKRSPFRLPLRQALRAWALGFTDWSYRLYDLEHREAGEYLSDRALALKGRGVLGRRSWLVRNKWNFHHLLESHGMPQPRLHGLIQQGRFRPGPGCESGDLFQLLESRKKLVIRPTWGGGGWGIFFLESESGALLVNGQKAGRDDVRALIQSCRDSVVTSFVRQAEYAKQVYPDTTNTLRLLILWDQEVDRPFLSAAAHRFGWRRSGPLDNFHGGRGALSAPILNDGVLGPARTLDEQGRRLEFDHHPDTGTPITGMKVPDWQDLVQELLDCVERLSVMSFIGWDLVKTDDGWVCIEGNPFPGTKVWQVHRGLLAEPRTREFFRRAGVIG